MGLTYSALSSVFLGLAASVFSAALLYSLQLTVPSYSLSLAPSPPPRIPPPRHYVASEAAEEGETPCCLEALYYCCLELLAPPRNYLG